MRISAARSLARNKVWVSRSSSANRTKFESTSVDVHAVRADINASFCNNRRASVETDTGSPVTSRMLENERRGWRPNDHRP